VVIKLLSTTILVLGPLFVSRSQVALHMANEGGLGPVMGGGH
jgi:hypothetical protein